MPEKFKAIVIDNQNDKFSRKIEELSVAVLDKVYIVLITIL